MKLRGRKYRKGMVLETLEGRRAILKRVRGKHWDCDCGGANHKIHEGTLDKYYKEVKS